MNNSSLAQLRDAIFRYDAEAAAGIIVVPRDAVRRGRMVKRNQCGE